VRTASLILALFAALSSGDESWRRIGPALELSFPRDHGAHPEFRTEWWYVTGQLEDEGGELLGFQLTFFRSGLEPGAPAPQASDLRAREVWAAHLALTDVRGGRTHFAERLRRGSSALVRAEQNDLELELEDWSLARTKDGQLRLRAADPAAGIGLALELEPTKPLVRHGRGGVSPKGDEPGNASAYLSWTRLEAKGRVELDGRSRSVAGEAWLDHEWGSSQLGAGVVGWDWFGLQLEGGRELMIYSLRTEAGSAHPASAGTLVAADGSTRHLTREEIRIEVDATWPSPRSGATYPARWSVHVEPDLHLSIVPLVADCELVTEGSTGVTYWEGPVQVSGSDTGRGYVELVGYAHDMRGRL